MSVLSEELNRRARWQEKHNRGFLGEYHGMVILMEQLGACLLAGILIAYFLGSHGILDRLLSALPQ